jgi:hypothetical protein
MEAAYMGLMFPVIKVFVIVALERFLIMKVNSWVLNKLQTIIAGG